MNGTLVIAVFDKTVFDFSFLAAGATQTIIIERALPVVGMYYLWLGIRCHNRDFGGGTGTMVIEGSTTLPSDEDPAEFTNVTAPRLFAVIGNSTVFPSLTITSAAEMGPTIKLQLRAAQQTATATRCYAELSGAS